MNQVRESVTLPATNEPVLVSWRGYLTPVLGAFGWRINRSLPKDGSEAMTSPLKLATYTVATRPAAASWAGGVIYVSDGAAGAKVQASDGTNWVNLG